MFGSMDSYLQSWAKEVENSSSLVIKTRDLRGWPSQYPTLGDQIAIHLYVSKEGGKKLFSSWIETCALHIDSQMVPFYCHMWNLSWNYSFVHLKCMCCLDTFIGHFSQLICFVSLWHLPFGDLVREIQSEKTPLFGFLMPVVSCRWNTVWLSLIHIWRCRRS